MRPVLPALFNEASASGISLESVLSSGTVRLQMAGVPKCLQTGVDEVAGRSLRGEISLSFPPEGDPTPAGRGALPPHLREVRAWRLAPHDFWGHTAAQALHLRRVGREVVAPRSARRSLIVCLGPLPRPPPQAPPQPGHHPALDPARRGRERPDHRGRPSPAGAGGGIDKEPGTHPSARTVAKSPAARNSGCALCPPGARPGSVGPGGSG